MSARAALFFFLCGCLGGPRAAECIFDEDCATGRACFAGACTPGRHVDAGVSWCPALQPQLSDISQRLFKVGCAVKTGSCHTADAVSGRNPSNGLDLSGDPWPQLVNVPADNVAATADAGPLVRVRPGDPDRSFLLIKLRLATSRDPAYGVGMPPEHPGQECDDVKNAVAQWIQAGAQRN